MRTELMPWIFKNAILCVRLKLDVTTHNRIFPLADSIILKGAAMIQNVEVSVTMLQLQALSTANNWTRRNEVCQPFADLLQRFGRLALTMDVSNDPNFPRYERDLDNPYYKILTRMRMAALFLTLARGIYEQRKCPYIVARSDEYDWYNRFQVVLVTSERDLTDTVRVAY